MECHCKKPQVRSFFHREIVFKYIANLVRANANVNFNFRQFHSINPYIVEWENYICRNLRLQTRHDLMLNSMTRQQQQKSYKNKCITIKKTLRNSNFWFTNLIGQADLKFASLSDDDEKEEGTAILLEAPLLRGLYKST